MTTEKKKRKKETGMGIIFLEFAEVVVRVRQRSLMRSLRF